VDATSKGSKKKRLKQDSFEHNITQFSRGRRVLRSHVPNHINHHVHHIRLELTTKRLKAFPTKELQRAAPVAASIEVSQNHFDRPNTNKSVGGTHGFIGGKESLGYEKSTRTLPGSGGCSPPTRTRQQNDAEELKRECGFYCARPCRLRHE
jgi:hypothetical protein